MFASTWRRASRVAGAMVVGRGASTQCTVSTAAAAAATVRSSRLVSAAAVVSAGAALAALASSAAACTVTAEGYSSCDVIGDGLRGEFWKAKHSNLDVLELESAPVQSLVTKLRDKNTPDPLFMFLCKRLMNFVLEHAIAALPHTEDRTVTTPGGHKYAGLSLDSLDIAGIAVNDDGMLLSRSLESLLPGIPVYQGYHKSKEFQFIEAKPDLAGKHVIVLAPVLVSGNSVKATLETLKGMGVPGEDVTVVVLTMSPAACDLVATLEDTNVVTATLESRVRGRELIPGIGDLRKRYAQGMKVVDKEGFNLLTFHDEEK